MHEYRGVIHVHSTYSDGKGCVDRIADAANRTRADFVILTDHNTMKAREDGHEGRHGRVLLLVGEEITPDTNADHYLAFGIASAIAPSPDPVKNVEAVRRQGGIGIIAHPTGGAFVKGEYVEYPWTNWEAGPFSGIEIWNHSYDITGKSKNIFQLALYALFPWLSPYGPEEGVLETWDYFVSQRGRRVVAVGGVDAHAIISDYEEDFVTVSTYILVPDPFNGTFEHDSASVYAALREGRCFVGADKVADASSFRCHVESGGDLVQMGGTAQLARGATLVVSSPKPGLIRVIRDGEPLAEEWGSSLAIGLDRRGAYRVEVKRKACRRYVPWIFGNHVYVV